MLDYTSMLVQETINDIKRIGNIAKYSTQGFYIAYLIYALIAGAGFWFINAPLLALAVGYLIYDLHSTNHPNKSQDKAVKKLYGRIKQALKFFPLCVSLYSLYLTADTANAFTIITTAFMLISWLLFFVFDVIFSIIDKRIELFKAALKEDWENVIQPVKSVGNIIKKVTGQQVQTPTPTKNQIILQKKLKKHKAAKEKKKAEKTALKQQAKKEKQQVQQAKVRERKAKLTSKFRSVPLLRGSKKSQSTNESQLPAPDDKEEDNE